MGTECQLTERPDQVMKWCHVFKDIWIGVLIVKAKMPYYIVASNIHSLVPYPTAPFRSAVDTVEHVIAEQALGGTNVESPEYSANVARIMRWLFNHFQGLEV